MSFNMSPWMWSDTKHGCLKAEYSEQMNQITICKGMKLQPGKAPEFNDYRSKYEITSHS